VQNVEKLRIYIYMAAAAAEIFINCFRQRRRLLRTVWVSAAAARKSFKIFSHRRRRRLSRSAYTSSHDAC
jgi:hypothetical protein